MIIRRQGQCSSAFLSSCRLEISSASEHRCLRVSSGEHSLEQQARARLRSHSSDPVGKAVHRPVPFCLSTAVPLADVGEDWCARAPSHNQERAVEVYSGYWRTCSRATAASRRVRGHSRRSLYIDLDSNGIGPIACVCSHQFRCLGSSAECTGARLLWPVGGTAESTRTDTLYQKGE